MNRTILQKLRNEKLRVLRRLDLAIGGMAPREGGPEFSTEAVKYELADRTRAISAGGIDAMHHLVNRIGLRERIDENLSLLKHHRPYLESEHVLNITYNVLCGGVHFLPPTPTSGVGLRVDEPDSAAAGRVPFTKGRSGRQR